MLQNVETLHAICAHCRSGRPLTGEQRRWLGAALGRWLGHDCASLNEAFGLVQDHGGVPWWREQAMRRRDAALRELAARFHASLAVHGRARAIARLAERYATTCWPRDRLSERMPERYRGTAKEPLWCAFRSGAKMPISERRLRSLLGGG